MLDLRAPSLPSELGEPLDGDAYSADFRARRKAIRNGESWKLERRQHFEEGSPARGALRRGDWTEALRLFEARRGEVRKLAESDRRRNSFFRRLRVVEEPLTPYMQWELTWLRLRAEEGLATRVLLAKEVADAEAAGPLPEIVVLDGRVLYEVLYTEAGAPRGSRRFTDPDIIGPWVAYISEAYATAEDIHSYVERVVAPLPPPPAA